MPDATVWKEWLGGGIAVVCIGILSSLIFALLKERGEERKVYQELLNKACTALELLKVGMDNCTDEVKENGRELNGLRDLITTGRARRSDG
jgi:hypothetical protein